MRRFIFILMIALLPLRGWMGEAMATEMAAMYLIADQATNTPATADIDKNTSMPDCDMHKAAKANTTETSETKSTCTHCQACHATGLVSTVQIANFDQVQYAPPLAQNTQFASANIAHSQKPPIL
jgi:cytochrome c553